MLVQPTCFWPVQGPWYAAAMRRVCACTLPHALAECLPVTPRVSHFLLDAAAGLR